LLLLAACTSFTSSAGAVTVEPASFSGAMMVDAGLRTKELQPTKPGIFTISTHNPRGSATTSLTLAGSPSAGLTANGTATGAGKLIADSAATLIYFFQVVGPRVIKVPVIATAHGAISGSSTTLSGAAYVQVATNLGDTKFPVSGSCPYAYPKVGNIKFAILCGSYDTSVTVNATSSNNATTSAANSIASFASETVGAAGTAGASFSISLAIDPSFAEAAKYRIVVSKPIAAP
jgi:hypothetical protein